VVGCGCNDDLSSSRFGIMCSGNVVTLFGLIFSFDGIGDITDGVDVVVSCGCNDDLSSSRLGIMCSGNVVTLFGLIFSFGGVMGIANCSSAIFINS